MCYSSRPSIWMTVVPTRLPSRVLLPLWKHTRHHVSQIISCYFRKGLWLTENSSTGLQTPRLKRLAEIVSAQAIAQQEKLEYADDDEYGDEHEHEHEHRELPDVHEVEVEQ